MGLVCTCHQVLPEAKLLNSLTLLYGLLYFIYTDLRTVTTSYDQLSTFFPTCCAVVSTRLEEANFKCTFFKAVCSFGQRFFGRISCRRNLKASRTSESLEVSFSSINMCCALYFGNKYTQNADTGRDLFTNTEVEQAEWMRCSLGVKTDRSGQAAAEAGRQELVESERRTWRLLGYTVVMVQSGEEWRESQSKNTAETHVVIMIAASL